jgi:hypothetical protein
MRFARKASMLPGCCAVRCRFWAVPRLADAMSVGPDPIAIRASKYCCSGEFTSERHSPCERYHRNILGNRSGAIQLRSLRRYMRPQPCVLLGRTGFCWTRGRLQLATSEPAKQQSSINVDRMTGTVGQAAGGQTRYGSCDFGSLAPAANRCEAVLDHSAVMVAYLRCHLRPD